MSKLIWYYLCLSICFWCQKCLYLRDYSELQQHHRLYNRSHVPACLVVSSDAGSGVEGGVGGGVGGGAGIGGGGGVVGGADSGAVFVLI